MDKNPVVASLKFHQGNHESQIVAICQSGVRAVNEPNFYVKMLGRLITHLTGSWAAGCANSFRSARYTKGVSYLECRGVLLCERARHHRAQRGCLNSWPPINSTPDGRLCPFAPSCTAETDVARVLCGDTCSTLVSALQEGANRYSSRRHDVFAGDLQIA